MLDFQNATLFATKITFKDALSESKGVRGGCKALFLIQFKTMATC